MRFRTFLSHKVPIISFLNIWIRLVSADTALRKFIESGSSVWRDPVPKLRNFSDVSGVGGGGSGSGQTFLGWSHGPNSNASAHL